MLLQLLNNIYLDHFEIAKAAVMYVNMLTSRVFFCNFAVQINPYAYDCHRYFAVSDWPNLMINHSLTTFQKV